MTEPRWFESRAEYVAATAAERESRRQDALRVAAQPVLRAHCEVCAQDVDLTVDTGLRFGSAVNLREGLVCPQCGLNQRQRLLFAAALRTGATRGFVLERLTTFYARLAKRIPDLVGSEYVDAALKSGEHVERYGFVFLHEDVTRLSFADASFDVVVHGDVFEHVADYRAGFRELVRVLRPGGTTLFTVPFMEHLHDHDVRAVIENGEIRHLQPPEIHGNPIDERGSLVFQVYGWRLLGELRDAGFRRAEIGLGHDVARGYVPSNSPFPNVMEAVLFRAQR
jgi:SAM-dependent methyltransferase